MTSNPNDVEITFQATANAAPVTYRSGVSREELESIIASNIVDEFRRMTVGGFEEMSRAANESARSVRRLSTTIANAPTPSWLDSSSWAIYTPEPRENSYVYPRAESWGRAPGTIPERPREYRIGNDWSVVENGRLRRWEYSRLGMERPEFWYGGESLPEDMLRYVVNDVIRETRCSMPSRELYGHLSRIHWKTISYGSCVLFVMDNAARTAVLALARTSDVSFRMTTGDLGAYGWRLGCQPIVLPGCAFVPQAGPLFLLMGPGRERGLELSEAEYVRILELIEAGRLGQSENLLPESCEANKNGLRRSLR